MEQTEVSPPSWTCTGVQMPPSRMPVTGRVREHAFTRPFGSAGCTPQEPVLVIGKTLRTHTRSIADRRIGRLMVTTEIVNAFRLEKELEDYLESHLSLPGQRLLIIGRQVKRGNQIRRGKQVLRVGARIDLLAIDATGVIYTIELKLGKASESIIAQILRYRRRIKRMDREELVRHVADGQLKLDLVKAFRQHFGHPLPETIMNLRYSSSPQPPSTPKSLAPSWSCWRRPILSQHSDMWSGQAHSVSSRVVAAIRTWLKAHIWSQSRRRPPSAPLWRQVQPFGCPLTRTPDGFGWLILQISPVS